MIKKKYTAALPVQLTPEWRARVQAVADHEQIGDSMASVIRDCIEVALPRFELELGLVELDDVEPAGEPELPAEPEVRIPGTSTGWGPDRPR